MTNNIIINGKQDFMGVEIPVISGGFSDDKKVILAKDIARTHSEELRVINQSINRMIERGRIKYGIHYIDIKQVTDSDVFLNMLKEENILTQAQIGNSKNIYLLSERGYASLIKYMDDDKSWEVHDKLIDEYFTMRNELKISDKDLAIINIVNSKSDIERALAIQNYTEIVQTPLKEEIEELTPKANSWKDYMDSSGCITMSNLAKSLNIKGIGRNKMFEVLRDKEILRANNEPYQRFVNSEYFVVKNGIKNGYPFTQTLITTKGMEWISKKMREWGYIETTSIVLV